jgi:hypothetical protein
VILRLLLQPTSLSLLSFLRRVIKHCYSASGNQSRSFLAISIALFELEATDALSLEPCPHTKVMEDNWASYRHIQTGYLVSVLLYIDKVVADSNLIFIQTRALIPEDKKCRPSKRMLMNGPCFLHNLYTADCDAIVSAVLSHIFQTIKISKVGFCMRPLRPKGSHLFLAFAWWGTPTIYYKDLIHIECSCWSNKITKVLLLLDIEHEHVRLWSPCIEELLLFSLLIFLLLLFDRLLSLLFFLAWINNLFFWWLHR